MGLLECEPDHYKGCPTFSTLWLYLFIPSRSPLSVSYPNSTLSLALLLSCESAPSAGLSNPIWFAAGCRQLWSLLSNAAALLSPALLPLLASLQRRSKIGSAALLSPASTACSTSSPLAVLQPPTCRPAASQQPAAASSECATSSQPARSTPGKQHCSLGSDCASIK